MAIAGQSVVFPGIANRPTTSESHGQSSELRAGRVLLFGGATYAAAYVVVGSLGLSMVGAFLAIVGTGLLFLGLKLIVTRL